jgi:hypothetical protein
MAEPTSMGGLRGALGIPSTVPSTAGGLTEDLATRLEQAKTEYRKQFGKELPITSGFRTREEQEKLFAERAKNPNLVAPPGESRHEFGNAVDISPAVPDSFLNQFGLHRPHGAKDPVHVELMPTQQTTETSSTSGLRSALGFGTTEEKQNAQNVLAPREEINFQNLQKDQPSVPRLFEPKTPAQKLAQQMIESFPGSKQLGEFGNVAAGTISKSVNAVQQLVGQYFPGLTDEQRKTIVENSIQGAKQTESALRPIEEESPKTALAGEVTGFLVNPINKLIPAGKATQSLIGAGTQAGFQGMLANVLTTPVTDEKTPFEIQKINQGLVGFGGGVVGGVAFHTLGNILAKGVDNVRSKFGGALNNTQVDEAATKIIADSGIDPAKVPVEFFDGLKDQAKTALQTGNVKGFQQFAQNYSLANSLPVPVPSLRGQLTRDPMQYAVEQNLRGIQGVGEPIQTVLQKQNSALLQNLDAFGAKSGQDITSSGHFLRNALRQADKTEGQKVKDAYTAYKNSTGRDIDVPLQGLAQDYAKVLHDYGSTVPSGVRNNFEALGLLKGNQLKVTTIDDAENLIKVINKNYDKLNLPQKNALDELRNSVNKAINDAGANLPGEAGAAAKAARDAASKRFTTIESIPALRDVLKGKEPDKFVQNHILGGNVDQISKLTKYLEANNPEVLNQIRNDVVRHIKQRVMNNVSEENAKFSQPQLKEFLSDTTGQRLQRFLSPEQMAGLKQLNKVAENNLVEPVSSAVNKSNTAQAAANLVQGTVKSGALNELLTNVASIKFPGVTWGAKALQEANQRSRAGEMIQQAVNPAAVPPTTPIRTLVRPGVAGAGATVGTTRLGNIAYEKENQ